ncbi:MAG: hypothetical protein Kow0069_33330 [Promethearchaeota archaeon]
MSPNGEDWSAVERLRTCVGGEEPDRVPMFLMAVPAYSRVIQELSRRCRDFQEWFADPEHQFRSEGLSFFEKKPRRLAVRHFLGADVQNYPVNVRPPGDFHDLYLDDAGREVDDAAEVDRLRRAGRLRRVDVLGHVHAERLLPGGHVYSWYVDGYLKTKREVLDWHDAWGWPDEWNVDPVPVAALREFERAHGEHLAIVPQVGRMQLYESSWPVMGLARWQYYSRTDPAFVRRIVESRKNAQARILERIKPLAPLLVMGGDDLGQKGRPQVSPAWFDEFLARPYAELFEKVHEELGAKVFIHCCGNVVDLLPRLVACGLDGWQSLEPASGITLDVLAALKRKFPEFLFVGGVDTTRVLPFGTPRDVEAHVRGLLRVMAPGGRFIVGPAHDYLDVPLENALAFKRAARRWGRYSIE